MSNQCESKFDGDVSFSCVLGLVADIRTGVTSATIMRALWIAGCLIAKFSPVQKSDSLPDAEPMAIAKEPDLQDALDALHAIVQLLHEQNSMTVSSLAMSPPVRNQGWEALIPVFLELFKIIMENRKKKQQPAPQPGT